MMLLSAGTYYFITQYSFDDFYKRLEIRAVVMAKTTLDHENASVTVLQEMRKMHLEKLPEEKEYYFEILEGKDFQDEATQLNLPQSFFQQVIGKGDAVYKSGNTFFAGIRYTAKSGNFIVIVSADNYHNIHFLSYLRNIFLAGIVIVSVVTLLLSILFARRVFNPVKEITNQAKEISSRSLHLRLETTKQKDEVGELAHTFNNMLDRLETSFATQNNFISNASHELNTPLTAIIGQAEIALSKERSSEEHSESLRIILNKAERLHEITKSLLYLAQTGFTVKVEEQERLRADQLLWDVKETIDKIHPGNNIQINMGLMPENPEKLKIKGNSRLLQIAISNIISNAIKYSNQKPVLISIGTSERDVIIVVKDSGIGIPQDELLYIYDPFFRAANTKEYEGYGIGLPLTRNIVRLHNGEILVTSKEKIGTTVQLTFPIDLSLE